MGIDDSVSNCKLRKTGEGQERSGKRDEEALIPTRGTNAGWLVKNPPLGRSAEWSSLGEGEVEPTACLAAAEESMDQFHFYPDRNEKGAGHERKRGGRKRGDSRLLHVDLSEPAQTRCTQLQPWWAGA